MIIASKRKVSTAFVIRILGAVLEMWTVSESEKHKSHFLRTTWRRNGFPAMSWVWSYHCRRVQGRVIVLCCPEIPESLAKRSIDKFLWVAMCLWICASLLSGYWHPYRTEEARRVRGAGIAQGVKTNQNAVMQHGIQWCIKSLTHPLLNLIKIWWWHVLPPPPESRETLNSNAFSDLLRTRRL